MNTRLRIIAALGISLGISLGAAFQAHAQSKPPPPPPDANGAPMARPPAGDPGPPGAPGDPGPPGNGPANPDNMPIKRPAPPPNSDRMLHHNPASDAIAK